jgi:hypothetical protein
MHKHDFRIPIRVIERPGEPVREIYSADEALDFLLAWPGKKSRAYDDAFESCFAVTADIEHVDAAQNAFRRFARLSGILSVDMMTYRARPGDTHMARR